MRVLITGGCGFVGCSMAQDLLACLENVDIIVLDNLSRPGTEGNRLLLSSLGVKVSHGDVRCASDLDTLPAVDWVIDAAANPNVLAGIDGKSSARQLFENNLLGTLNILEFCRRVTAGLVLLSTSRVYSIDALSTLPLVIEEESYALDEGALLPRGVSENGIGIEFSTAAPISLYGSSKLASELVALEYSSTYSMPVWINRCGVLAGAGQFGVSDQGIIAFWLNSHLRRRPLRYLGFGGSGKQSRDALHPRDLAQLVLKQIACGRYGGQRSYTVGGGVRNSFSLLQLTKWCDRRFGPHPVDVVTAERRFDIPWLVMSSVEVMRDFNWEINISLEQILTEVSKHAEENPEWLDRCRA